MNVGINDQLRIFDGWALDGDVPQLAYFKNHAGDRSSELARGGATSVSGGPSSRLLYSSTSVLTFQLITGSSEIRSTYSQAHGDVPFPAQERFDGFSLTHKCGAAPDPFPWWGIVLFVAWWVLSIWCLVHAYQRINYGAKSGGLWKMDIEGLRSIEEAMQIEDEEEADLDHKDIMLDRTGRSELIAKIIQHEHWPHRQIGLALSSFETVTGDDEPAAWVDVSILSPNFILTVVACVAAGVVRPSNMPFISRCKYSCAIPHIVWLMGGLLACVGSVSSSGGLHGSHVHHVAVWSTQRCRDGDGMGCSWDHNHQHYGAKILHWDSNLLSSR